MQLSKKKIKEKIKSFLIKKIEFEKLKDELLVNFTTSPSCTVSALTINKKSYKVKDNCVIIPYTPRDADSLLGKKNRITVKAFGKTVNFNYPKSIVKYNGEYITVNGIKHKVKENDLMLITSIMADAGDLVVGARRITGGEEAVKIALLSSGGNHSDVASFENNEYRFHDVMKSLDSARQLIAIHWKDAYPVILRDRSDVGGGLSVSQEGSDLFVQDEQYRNYAFGATNDPESIKKIINKNTLPVSVENSNGLIKIIFKSEKDGVLFLEDLLNETEELVEAEASAGCIIVNPDMLLEKKRDYFERSVLKYRYYEKNEEVEAYIRLADNIPNTLESHILAENENNRIVCAQNGIITIENKDCYITYQNKLSFDFARSSFYTDVSNVQISDSSLEMDLTIHAPLLPISSITFFATDNYKKRTYFIEEIYLEDPSTYLEERIIIDLSKINIAFYYNSRLSLKIGVTYINGYKEEDFLRLSPRVMSASEKYFYVTPEDSQGMVTCLYMGPNYFNFNIWYTSGEEYRKVLLNEEGKDIYFMTVESEDIDNKLIFFEANLGKNYTGNPKYLYEYMISRPEYKAFKFVWAYPDINTKLIPGNPTIVKRGSSEYYYYFAKAKYRINNIRFPLIHKRPGAVYLNTWHGTPLKRLGFDIECDGPEKQAFGSLYAESKNWDYMTVDNDYGEEKLVSAFRFKGNVIKKGYPINDIYYDKERLAKIKKRLESKYPPIKGKSVILYAPTWRDLQGDYVRGYEFSLPFGIEEMQKQIGDKCVLLVKLHHLIADNLNIDEKYKDFIINASDEEDIMELLSMTDVLVTDYSSVFYDFASAHKPIIFYMYDLREYLDETRGTYVPVDTLPGPIVEDERELIKQINDVMNGNFEYRERLEEFCDEFSKYCKGTSSRDVLDIVIEKEDLQ